MTTNGFSQYRKRLIDKGILGGATRGYVDFKLPPFDSFVLEQAEGNRL